MRRATGKTTKASMSIDPEASLVDEETTNRYAKEVAEANEERRQVRQFELNPRHHENQVRARLRGTLKKLNDRTKENELLTKIEEFLIAAEDGVS